MKIRCMRPRAEHLVALRGCSNPLLTRLYNQYNEEEMDEKISRVMRC